jgi:hypothetical protein
MSGGNSHQRAMQKAAKARPLAPRADTSNIQNGGKHWGHWIAGGVAAVTVIVLFLVPRSPCSLIFGGLLVFFSCVHFVWNAFEWIRKFRVRQGFAVLVLLGVLLAIGWFFWPIPEISMSCSNMVPIYVAPGGSVYVLPLSDERGPAWGLHEIRNETPETKRWPPAQSLNGKHAGSAYKCEITNHNQGVARDLELEILTTFRKLNTKNGTSIPGDISSVTRNIAPIGTLAPEQLFTFYVQNTTHIFADVAVPHKVRMRACEELHYPIWSVVLNRSPKNFYDLIYGEDLMFLPSEADWSQIPWNIN